MEKEKKDDNVKTILLCYFEIMKETKLYNVRNFYLKK